jgi:CARDB
MSRARLVLAAGVCSVAAVLMAAAAGASTPAATELRAFVCQRALNPPARAVSIQAVMRPMTGTSKMQMRFDLMRQTKPGARFRLVPGRLLGSWISPDDPTLGQRAGDVWIVNHPVVDLAGPATYQFRVSFRWTGAGGQELQTAVQTSPDCYQPELRADLLARSLSVTPLDSGRDTYTAVIANRGATGAGPVEVELAGAGSAAQTARLAWVGPRSSARQRFVAPACPAGASLTVTVDPAHTVDEYDFANNALTVACPASGAGSGSPAPSG